MSEHEVLLRRLEREIRARKEAENISEKKMSEIYEANRSLEKALKKQKRISEILIKRTQALEKQKIKTEFERLAKGILENVLESCIDYSIISTDLSGTVLVWNEGARRTYGYEAEEMINKQNIKILYSTKDIEAKAAQNFFDTAYHEERAEKDFQHIRKDGTEFIASVVISLRRDDENIPIGYVMVSKDITDAKRLKEQLMRSNQELEQFAYITSHDLKAPLRAIEQLSCWIEEDNADILTEKSKEHLALLRQRVIRMSDLIDGVLQYSRAGRVDLDIHTVDTKQLLKEIIDSLNPPPAFTILYNQNLPTFKTSKTPLSQVFSNLISNSIKYHHRNNGTIEIGVRIHNACYEFFVKDDGPGIESQYFDKIFQIFQTLQSRDEIESTGIGLSIVKKIVESQGGQITVQSKKGKGTTFFFTWPKKISEKSLDSFS